MYSYVCKWMYVKVFIFSLFISYIFLSILWILCALFLFFTYKQKFLCGFDLHRFFRHGVFLQNLVVQYEEGDDTRGEQWVYVSTDMRHTYTYSRWWNTLYLCFSYPCYNTKHPLNIFRTLPFQNYVFD